MAFLVLRLQYLDSDEVQSVRVKSGQFLLESCLASLVRGHASDLLPLTRLRVADLDQITLQLSIDFGILLLQRSIGDWSIYVKKLSYNSPTTQFRCDTIPESWEHSG